MNQIVVKCDVCKKSVIFADDPYDVPGATRYWKSTYDEPKESLFVIQRRIPTEDKNGRKSIQILYEHILKIYCGVDCGLKDYETT